MQGRPALAEAARLGMPTMVRLLLDRGANPNLSDPSMGSTPLHMASEGLWGVMGHEEEENNISMSDRYNANDRSITDTIELLLSRDAAPNTPDISGRTPLHVVVSPPAAAAMVPVVSSLAL